MEEKAVSNGVDETQMRPTHPSLDRHLAVFTQILRGAQSSTTACILTHTQQEGGELGEGVRNVNLKNCQRTNTLLHMHFRTSQKDR